MPAQHPETHALHLAGTNAIRHIEQAGPTAERVAIALEEERNALYPMVWEECSEEQAARRAEWYAKVMRSYVTFCR